MKKTALIFPGQGSQYIGMGKKLCDKFKSAKLAFEEANDTLGFDLYKLCTEGSIEELTNTENAQPAILTVSVAAFRAYMEDIAIEPDFCAGHSLGELSALACANAVSFSDAVKIVRKRGELMSNAVLKESAMAAISGVSRDILESECRNASELDSIVVISNYNVADQTVISGLKSGVDIVTERVSHRGAVVTPLKVSAPFHSPHMQPAADKFRAFLTDYSFNDIKYCVISNVNALPYAGKEAVADNLVMQIVKPVQWLGTMEYLKANGIEQVVELGPKTVLRNLWNKNISGIKAFSYDMDEDINVLKGKEGNLDLIIRCLAIAVCTKNNNWDNNEYEKGVIAPYRRIKEMLDSLEQEGKNASIEQMTAALEMLRSVFMTKKTPADEQAERFNQIFTETGTKHLFPDFSVV